MSDWKDKLRKGFDTYSETPPEGLWEAVEAGIPPSRRAFPGWWALAGAAAAVAALLVIMPPRAIRSGNEGLVAEVPDSSEVQKVSGGAVVSGAPADTVSGYSATADTAGAGHDAASGTATGLSGTAKGTVARPAGVRPRNLVAQASAPEAGSVNQEAVAVNPVTLEEVEETPEVAPEVVREDVREDVRDTSEAASDVASDVAPVTVETTPEQESIIVPDPFASEGDRRVAFVPSVTSSLIAGGVPGGASSATFTEYGMSGTYNTAARTGSMPLVSTLSRNKSTTTDVDHSVAARFGMMVGVSLTPRWGVETGLMLTALDMNSKSQTGSMVSFTKRGTWYAGVPLLAVYTPLRIGRFSLYTSAGPMVEYSFVNNWNTSSYVSGRLIDETSGSDEGGDLIFSAGVNAGVQWSMGPLGGIFLQPGLSWHFAREDAPDSYYTVHPLALSVSAGLRLQF